MKLSIPNAVTTRFARQVLLTQKNSPKILFGTGLVLMGATVITACKGTLSLSDELEHIRAEREDVKAVVARNPGKYTDREIAKLDMYITVKGMGSVVKLYLPSIALGVATVACLTKSHNQLTRRNAGLSAALAATERALDAYRNRVRDAYGEDRERELWRGEHTVEVPILDDEGNPTKSKKKVKVGGGYSPYARLWGQETSTEWDPQSSYNLPKLRTVQEWATLRLEAKGYLFLNEVHRQLGLSETEAGQYVGWMSKKHGGKDGYVDLGVLAHGDEVAFLDFLNGDEDHIWLDFNVDGEIARIFEKEIDR